MPDQNNPIFIVLNLLIYLSKVVFHQYRCMWNPNWFLLKHLQCHLIQQIMMSLTQVRWFFFDDGKDVTKNAKFSEIFCIAVSLFLAFKLCWGFPLIVFFLSIPPSESFEKYLESNWIKKFRPKRGKTMIWNS